VSSSKNRSSIHVLLQEGSAFHGRDRSRVRPKVKGITRRRVHMRWEPSVGPLLVMPLTEGITKCNMHAEGPLKTKREIPKNRRDLLKMEGTDR
jgi:hypothetical protein